VTTDVPVSGEPRRAAVLGHPVGHSLSPVLHRAAYARLGLAGWTYQAVDVDEAGLPGFFAGLDQEWVGLSLTMPLKRAVLALLSSISPLAAAVGAVNTVTFAPDGAIGDNTDVPGMVAALAESGVVRVRRAVVLGGGATATSAIAALSELGCDEPSVHVRSPSGAAELRSAAERLAVRPVLRGLGEADLTVAAGVDLVVSTLPGTAADALAAALLRAARDGAAVLPVLLDVVYAPWPTLLARRWQEAGGRVVGGFGMLLHQAADQVRLMTGLPAPVEAMRAAGESELARRARLPGG
jgi:shikimate dehydrogenase